MPDIKKIAALFTSAVIALSTVGTVFAEPDTDAPEDNTAQENVTDTAAAPAGGIYMEDPTLSEPDTSLAEAALLMDMNTGRLIYGKNIDEQLYPASTTKMMTAILALESGRMADTATATYEALQSITLEDSHMGILIGEELSMPDLVNGMMVASANDAANVIAVHIGGSIEAFVDMMNRKAQELGMTGTHFANPCGVQDDNHYTTAQDLAVLAKYCMQNEDFREIVKQPRYHMEPTNKYQRPRDLLSTNLFLGTSRSAYYYYKPCTGIKTGTTEAAGHCLVASAEYNNMSLLTVVLKCNDEDYNEKAYSYIVTKRLFDFGFNNYRAGTLATPGNIVADSKVYEAKDDKRVTLTVDADVNALVPNTDNDISKEVEVQVSLPDTVQAPVTKGDMLGTVLFMYRGTQIGSANLIAANDVEQNMILHYIHVGLAVLINPLFFIPVILIIIIAMIARARKKRRDRKRRIQQLRQRKGLDAEGFDRTTRNSELNRSRSKAANSRYSGDRR